MKSLILSFFIFLIIPSIVYPTRKIDLGEKGKKIVNERSEAIKKAEEAARLAKQKQIEAQKAQQEKEDWIRSVTEQRANGIPLSYVVPDNITFQYQPEDKGQPAFKSEVIRSERDLRNSSALDNIWERAVVNSLSRPAIPGHPARVKLVFSFCNRSPDTVAGLSYKIEFLDKENKVIYSEDRKKEKEIAPWSSTDWESNAEYFTEDTSKNNDPYDKIGLLAKYGNLKARVIVTEVAWTNGKVTGNIPVTEKPSDSGKEAIDQNKKIADQKKRQAKIKSVNDQRAKGIIIPYVTATCNMELYDLSNPEYKKSPDGIYPHSIKFNIDLSNNTNAEIKGIILNLQIIGQSGNLLLRKEYKLQDIIEPWGSLYIWPIFHDYADKPDDECDKVYSALKNKTAKVEIEINRISWANGAITGNLPKIQKKENKNTD